MAGLDAPDGPAPGNAANDNLQYEDLKMSVSNFVDQIKVDFGLKIACGEYSRGWDSVLRIQTHESVIFYVGRECTQVLNIIGGEIPPTFLNIRNIEGVQEFVPGTHAGIYWTEVVPTNGTRLNDAVQFLSANAEQTIAYGENSVIVPANIPRVLRIVYPA